MKTFLYTEALTIDDSNNIVAIRNLVQFYQKHPDAKSSWETWLPVTKNATWQKPSNAVQDFPDADPVKNS